MADKTGYIGRNPGDSSVQVARQTFTPSTATTDFTFASGYTVGLLDLYVNGAKQIEGTDFNANDGSTISMVTDAQSGDVLEAVAYKAFNVGDAASSTAGNFDVGNDITVGNDAKISNDLNVTGIGTIGEGFNVSAGGANISGVVTATSYKGDGSALTGIAATDTIAAASLTVSGITTLTGAVQAKSTTESTTKDTGGVIVEGGVGIEKNLNVGGMSVHTGIATFSSDVRITGNINAGIATFTSVTGDGSGLTGVANTDVVHTREITATGISTFSNDVQFNRAVGTAASITWDASAKELLILDGVKTIYGDGGDLSIYHSVTTSKNIYQGDSHQFWNKAGNENLATLTADGACDLYYDSNKKLETTLTGAKTTGVSSCTSHCMPTADVGGDLGSTTNRWANVYTADMQLSNEGSQNDIDGTWGKYTIQEGEDDLFLINRRTGKKYKFMLEEVQ